MSFTTRFTPSPTGPLHLGHAYSALRAHDLAQEAGGVFLLRFDDIDGSRARAEWEAQAIADLRWLGLEWPEPVLRQSASAPQVGAALARLAALGLLYPCSCSRADVEAAAGAPQEGVATHGPDGRIYPGTCRGRPLSDRQPGDALRLDMARAAARLNPMPRFTDIGEVSPGDVRLDPDLLTGTVGDVVLSRRGGAMAYHLSVVVDDAGQEITHVVRGADLFDATPIHVLLQALLGFRTPTYWHHRLIRDDQGKRLAKRDDARAILRYREDGLSPADLRRMVGL